MPHHIAPHHIAPHHITQHHIAQHQIGDRRLHNLSPGSQGAIVAIQTFMDKDLFLPSALVNTQDMTQILEDGKYSQCIRCNIQTNLENMLKATKL